MRKVFPRKMIYKMLTIHSTERNGELQNRQTNKNITQDNFSMTIEQLRVKEYIDVSL